MDISQFLSQQRRLYTELPDHDTPQLATHPLSGEWQRANYLKNEFWWGGGATQEACKQLKRDCCQNSQLTGMAALSFGPVQDFLGGGQRLRDWAVASWLCHYLSAVFIYRWEQEGGCILLPLHLNSPLVNWLNGQQANIKFWQAELPNVFTGLFPETEGWLDKARNLISEEWQRFVTALEQSAIDYHSKLLNGQGWQVIRQDHQYLWSVYAESASLQDNGNSENLATIAASLHQNIEAQKLGRNWQKKWWGGRTSPTAGQLSTWHPGLMPVDKGGTWGLPDSTLTQWWQWAAQESRLSGLFSESDRLNSIELVKRLASVPDIIEPTLERLWGRKPPSCPWEQFPDRTAVAAAWVPKEIPPELWNDELEILNDYYCSEYSAYRPWGMPHLNENPAYYVHPRSLERRNISKENQKDWEQQVPQGWESAIEWSVGWRGDGDQIGEWLSGRQYEQKNLPWQQWHLSQETIDQYGLNIEPPNVPKQPRQLELPHLLDLSVLFRYWNGLLYRLSEEKYNSKVIFAGGDDFLIIGPITDTVPLSSQLHKLWLGQASDLTNPLPNSEDGWSDYQGEVYPIPGQKMSFSLGVVIAQRRIPQSLWHRGLDEAYKKAKKQGRDRVCVKVLFNSGQTLEWVCPWPLWHLLMEIEPKIEEKTDLNRWEKLLSYLESTRLEQENSPEIVQDLLDTLWASVGLPLSWQQVEDIAKKDRELHEVIETWSWWRNWIAVRAFLTRQERDRAKLIEKLTG